MKKVNVIPIILIFIFSFISGTAQIADTCIVKIKVVDGENPEVIIDTSFYSKQCNAKSINMILKDLDLDTLLNEFNIEFDTLLCSEKGKPQKIFIKHCDTISSSDETHKHIIKLLSDSIEGGIRLENMDGLLKDIDVDVEFITDELHDGSKKMIIKTVTSCDSLIGLSGKEHFYISEDENVKLIKIGEGETPGEMVKIKTIVKEKDGEIITTVITTEGSDEKKKITKDEFVTVESDHDAKTIEHKVIVKGDKTKDIIIIKSGLIKIRIDDISRKEKSKLPENLKLKPKDNLKLKNLEYYPNPNDGRFTLRFDLPDNEESTITIFDMHGKELFKDSSTATPETYEKEIDISGYGKGTYILKVETGNKMASKKIIVE